MRELNTRTTGHDIHSMMRILDMEEICMIIGRMINIMLICGEEMEMQVLLQVQIHSDDESKIEMLDSDHVDLDIMYLVCENGML